MSRETLSLEQGRERVDEPFLVAVLVALGDGSVALRDAVGVVVGDVGDDTTDTARRASGLVDLGVELGGRCDVRLPPEPSSVAAVEVHVDVGKIEGLEGVDGERLVDRSSLAALGDVHVGDHVGERIGLDGKVDWDIGVFLDDGGNLVNVLGLVDVLAILVNCELAVGGESSAVTVWEIVDDKGSHELRTVCVLGLDVRKVLFEEGNLRARVHPDERSDLGNSRGCRLQGGGERWDSKVLDLRGVVWVSIPLLARKGVTLLPSCDGGSARRHLGRDISRLWEGTGETRDSGGDEDVRQHLEDD